MEVFVGDRLVSHLFVSLSVFFDKLYCLPGPRCCSGIGHAPPILLSFTMPGRKYNQIGYELLLKWSNITTEILLRIYSNYCQKMLLFSYLRNQYSGKIVAKAGLRGSCKFFLPCPISYPVNKLVSVDPTGGIKDKLPTIKYLDTVLELGLCIDYKESDVKVRIAVFIFGCYCVSHVLQHFSIDIA